MFLSCWYVQPPAQLRPCHQHSSILLRGLMSHPDVLLVADLSSVHVRRLARALVAAGLLVEIAAFDGESLDEMRVHSLGARPATDDRRYLLAIPRLARLIRFRSPRVVHAHYVSSFGLMTSLSIALAHPVGPRPGLVQTAWGTDLLVTARTSRLRAGLASVALRCADLVTGDSADLQASALMLAPNVPFHRLVFGPDARLFTAQRRPERVILSTRRLDPDTRVDLVVRAFRLAKAREPSLFARWRLIVAGSGTMAVDIRAAAESDTAIEFVGQLGADELRDWLCRASVYVSVPRSDGTSAALLEAMAAGVMPIVNDLPANRQWVNNGNGLVVDRDPDDGSLSRAIAEATHTGHDPESIRDAVRGVGWEGEVEKLVDQYRTIRPLSEPSMPPPKATPGD